MELTLEYLKENLSYDVNTGVFSWIKSYRNQHIGKTVGSFDSDGYRKIKIKRKLYRAHRLAWFYVNGVWPDGPLDHIDGVRDNNAINNLREVTFAGNSHNQRKAHKDAAHGFLGVDLNKAKGRFRARIQVNGKRVTLGGFSTAEEAHKAYVAAKRTMHGTCTI